MSKVKRNCEYCGNEFETYPCEIRKGGGKFCSRRCATTFRNIHNNPTKSAEVRNKISQNHADVSGKNNPMYGRRGEKAPSYIDGRNSFPGEIYRRKLLASGRKVICEICGATENLHVHHKDKNHYNNDIKNLSWLCVKCHNTIAHKHNRDSRGRFSN